MDLRDEMLDACGDVARWRDACRFTLHVTIDGVLPARAGSDVRLHELVAEASADGWTVRLIGLTGIDTVGVYRPGAVSIACRDDASRDALALVRICGLAIWRCLTVPFLLGRPEVHTEELSPWRDGDTVWRRLRATFPADLPVEAAEQTFYVDTRGLLRRVDYRGPGEPAIAEITWAHQAFAGIVIPTLRRALVRAADGTAVPKPILADLEIFDAAFL